MPSYRFIRWPFGRWLYGNDNGNGLLKRITRKTFFLRRNDYNSIFMRNSPTTKWQWFTILQTPCAQRCFLKWSVISFCTTPRVWMHNNNTAECACIIMNPSTSKLERTYIIIIIHNTYIYHFIRNLQCIY
jgi:hypothetical protein